MQRYHSKPALTPRALHRLSLPQRRAAPATTALFAAVGANTSLTTLSVIGCQGLPLSAIEAMALSLRRNKTLRELKLRQTRLCGGEDEGDWPGADSESAQAAASLLSAIGDGPQRGSLCALDSLDCTACFRAATFRSLLSDGLRGTALRLRELRLGGCDLGDAGAPSQVTTCSHVHRVRSQPYLWQLAPIIPP